MVCSKARFAGTLSALWTWTWLAVTSPLVRADLAAADYFVHSLPGAPPGPLLKMHAGHIPIDEQHHSHIFFWHFQNRHIANRQRTVIWFNGGPGCSSEDGALIEIGPYRVMSGANGPHLEYNVGSWDEFANILFIDNPVGTGFSVVDTDSYVTELPQMAEQFVQFLEKWFAIFPDHENDDIYLAGESYAGQHIPYIAKAMLDRNGKNPVHAWQLKGMLIGNGWISPVEQYDAYLAYAYEKGLVKRDSDISLRLESQLAVCHKVLEASGKDRVDNSECEQVLQDILFLTATGSTGNKQCYNMYDVRLRDSHPSCGMNWPPDLVDVTPYLRRHDVTDALHVSKEKKAGWSECNGAVGGAFSAINSKPSISFLGELIEQVPTILFSGDQDLICNHIGTENLISNMVWGGAKGFELSPGTWAPRQEWMFEGEDAGFWQTARNLTYVLFHNSSHMVPFDYARRTRDMLDRFMGVDIASIGGVPTDSRIDGEKGLETSVGGHPNSTAAAEAEQAKLQAAKWAAYYKSGEIVLVIVAIAASIWGWYIWRGGRRDRAGYKGIFGGDTPMARERRSIGMEGYAAKNVGRDLELADFDDGEFRENGRSPLSTGGEGGANGDAYSVGSASDDDDAGSGKARQEHANGNGKQMET